MREGASNSACDASLGPGSPQHPAQHLHDGVHVARVAEVLQTHLRAAGWMRAVRNFLASETGSTRAVSPTEIQQPSRRKH